MDFTTEGLNNTLSFVGISEDEQDNFNEYMDKVQDDEYYTRLYEDNNV